MRIALINLSSVPNDHMALIGKALKVYLGHVCDAWERKPIDIEFMPGTPTAPLGWTPLVAFEEPGQHDIGVLGYHDVDEQGRPYGRAFRSCIPNGTVLHDPSGGGASLADVLAHEAAEMALDILANAYQDGPFVDPQTGKSYSQVAVELADPVQELSYTIEVDGQLVGVSDFIYPSWFNRKARGGEKYDHLGKLTAPLTLAPGGYVIVRDNKPERTVFGRLLGRRQASLQKVTSPIAPSAWRTAMKLHHGGRTKRRLGG
jgi:hypothetical protein